MDMSKRRGSNHLLAWRDLGNANDVQNLLLRSADRLRNYGSTHSQNPDVPYDDWYRERLGLVAGLRDSTNALTAALAVEAIIDHRMTYREAAGALQVSSSAVHGWVRQALEEGLVQIEQLPPGKPSQH